MKRNGRPPIQIDREKLLAGIAAGKAVKQIAVELGVSYTSALRLVKREKLNDASGPALGA